MIKIRLWSIGQILLFLKPMDGAFCEGRHHYFHESYFALFSASLPANFHFFKAGVERNTSKEVCLQECFTRRVYYIVYVYTTLQQGPMLPLCSYVHFIFHVQIKLRHTTPFFVPVVNMLSTAPSSHPTYIYFLSKFTYFPNHS